MKKEKRPMPTKSGWHRFLLLPLNILYMEIIVRIVAGGKFFGVDLLAMALYSFVFGVCLTFLCSFAGERAGGRSVLGVQIGLSVWYVVQIIYHSFFGKFMILYSVFAGGADQVIASGLVENTLGAIAGCWWAFLTFCVPVAAVVVYQRAFCFKKIRWQFCLLGVGASILAYLLIVGGGLLVPKLKEIQTDVFNKEQSVKTFGLLRSEILDIRCNVLGLGKNGELEVDQPSEPVIAPVEQETKYNVTNIDFSALAAAESDEELKELHTYFASEKPSKQNDYTGMFSGYNLIQITAEGFSPYAIDPELTPTLYKMQTQGFNFTNFYTPIWEVSTSDGEYAATTGLIPKSGVWTYHLSGENKVLFPYTMPQQFLNSGVGTVRAYHNHNYAYYHRDISHTNLGFDYKGVGNGLELKRPKIWPESDLEMVQSTTAEYLDGTTPFMTYYMTVSGHLEYNFDGNYIAYQNRDLVSHLPYSETVRAYYACNMELDRAMEQLLADLEAAGVADKTVIVITPDHYPYGLEDKTQENMYLYFDEIAGHSIDPDFELYKSSLIIYSPSMTEPVTVDKYCSSLDIIPTLNNLFGFEYDSRLLIGRDILSDSEPLVIFMDRSFITDKGKYKATTQEFIPFEGQTVDEEYISRNKKAVRNKFKASALIVEKDYYRLVSGRQHLYSK